MIDKFFTYNEIPIYINSYLPKETMMVGNRDNVKYLMISTDMECYIITLNRDKIINMLINGE